MDARKRHLPTYLPTYLPRYEGELRSLNTDHHHCVKFSTAETHKKEVTDKHIERK